MPKPHRLGDLQLTILGVLWERGEASVADVHRELEEERGLALTTIATMLTKMEAKGVITHRAEGRRFIYRPRVSESEVRHSMVAQLTERLFDGNPAALVSHLLSEHELDAAELDALRKLTQQNDAAALADRPERKEK